MTETLRERLNQLVAKWAKQAQRLDDYRGIQMCMRDVEDAIKLTDVVPAANIKTALKQATDLLAQLRGKPFVPQMPVVIKTLDDACIVIRQMSVQITGMQRQIDKLEKLLEDAVIKNAPPQAVKVDHA